MKLPKIYLRDLFWMILVVAIALGWFMERSNLGIEIDALETKNKHYTRMEQAYRIEHERFEQLVREVRETPFIGQGPSLPPLEY